jgi:hypothetical protein
LTPDLPILAAINRGLARTPPVSLDPDEIEAYVLRREKVRQIPGDHWRDAYRLLCSDLAKEAGLTPLGRVMANGQLVGLLRARCRAERLLSRHPEIASLPLVRPIFIMGPMRSGSTRLQRLLACDRRLGWTRLFETLFPVPSGRNDRKRIVAAAAVQATLRMLNPAVQRIHPSGALRPDEEFGFLSFAFHSGQFAVQWDVPGFARAEAERDLLPVARELATLLRINAWARRDFGRPMILKCPAYSGMTDALLEVFPDARFICLERNPVEVVASSASLVFEQRRIHSNQVDKKQIGREWLTRTTERQAGLADFRRRRPDVPAFDLSYEEMGADWSGSMERLYRFLELSLEPQASAAMRRYTAKAKAHKGHRYRLEDYGLDEAEVCAAYAGPSAVSPVPSMIAAE